MAGTHRFGKQGHRRDDTELAAHRTVVGQPERWHAVGDDQSRQTVVRKQLWRLVDEQAMGRRGCFLGIVLQCQSANLGVQHLQINRGLIPPRLAAEHVCGLCEQLVLPVRDLVGMHVMLLRQRFCRDSGERLKATLWLARLRRPESRTCQQRMRSWL